MVWEKKFFRRAVVSSLITNYIEKMNVIGRDIIKKVQAAFLRRVDYSQFPWGVNL
jgi:hypothetical protein